MWYFSLWETWYLHDDRLHNITSHFSLLSVGCCLPLSGRRSSVRLYQRERTCWLAGLRGPPGISELWAPGDNLLAAGYAAVWPSVSPPLADHSGEAGRGERSVLWHHIAQVSSNTVRASESQSVPTCITIFRENDYFCTLDLSLSQYCGQQFSFSLRVLAQQDTGRQWLSSPRKSLLQLQCGGLSSVTSVLAPPQQGNCAGYKPVWRLEPLFYRVDPINYRSLKLMLALMQSRVIKYF